MCIKDNQELHIKSWMRSTQVKLHWSRNAGGGWWLSKVFPKTKYIPKINQPIYSVAAKAAGKSRLKSLKQTISRATRRTSSYSWCGWQLESSTQLQVLQGYGSRRVQLRQSKKEKRLSRLPLLHNSQTPPIRETKKAGGQGIVILAFPKCMIPNSFSVNMYTLIPNWNSYTLWLHAKLSPRLNIIA